MSALADEIQALYRSAARSSYGEVVTLLEHSLLTAWTAERAQASDSMVLAALLHDIGHLLEGVDDDYGKHTHDAIGGAWLAQRFPRSVSEPVRLHVDAKRYLCSVEPGYVDQLSPASRYTLGRQGGPMSADEVSVFEAREFSQEAVQLRRWEDAFAKTSGDFVPAFGRYRPLIEALATG